ncbi:alpha/beta hydrolase [Phytomonospora sp. NPDC050363]|uniref:alpha/beta hydrolase n=1 Tax=Phytomonospora sp. NPDC050363 TaxID=3155642 RepID=UPI0033DBD8F6
METDHLGDAYRFETIPLGTDREGDVVATLVERCDNPPDGPAVLYVHGFSDYFFHPHVADFYRDRGYAFYALDMRKSGRSIRPGHTPYLVGEISDYFPELTEAVTRIHRTHGKLLINAHSTGALAVALWAEDTRGRGLVDALVFNSPFLTLNAPRSVRFLGSGIARTLGRFSPLSVVPLPSSGANVQSIYAGAHGEWDFNVEWKPLTGVPVRMGWLRAVVRAQARLRRGLHIEVPVLAASAGTTYRRLGWTPEAMTGDAVLDADAIAKAAVRLGEDVTVVRIPDGMHDLALSGEAARARLFKEIGVWLDARFD